MVRTAEALEGLAVLGQADLSGRSFPTPLLLLPEGTGLDGTLPTLSYSVRSTAPGQRTVTVGPVQVDWPVATPDLEPEAGEHFLQVGPIAFVRGPLDPTSGRRLASTAPDLIVLTNARHLLLEGEPFVEAIGAIREFAGARPLLWAPRVATANRVPFLVYAGVDLLDPTQAFLDAAAGHLVDPELGPSSVDRDGAAPGTLEPHSEETVLANLAGQITRT